MLESWRSRGVPASALTDERSEQVIGWLRANWREPQGPIADVEHHLQLLTEGVDAVVVLDFWRWDDAVAVLVPVSGLLRITHGLREIYPDGFLAADQSLSKGLLVDFDEHVQGAEIAEISDAAR